MAHLVFVQTQFGRFRKSLLSSPHILYTLKEQNICKQFCHRGIPGFQWAKLHLVLCRVVAVKRFPKHYHSAEYIYVSAFGIIDSFRVILKLDHCRDPNGHMTKNDVVLTSMRRDYVASTSIQRHFGTKCPMGRVTGVAHFINGHDLTQ